MRQRGAKDGAIAPPIRATEYGLGPAHTNFYFFSHNWNVMEQKGPSKTYAVGDVIPVIINGVERTAVVANREDWGGGRFRYFLQTGDGEELGEYYDYELEKLLR
jgi:hypothetical protein